MDAIHKGLFGMLMMIFVAVGCSPEPKVVLPLESLAERKARAMERERMKIYENLRTIDGHTYGVAAYLLVVDTLATSNCRESHQKIGDMAAFSKGKLRGISAYEILMDVEMELRGMPKRDCADIFAAYILLKGG